MIVSDKEPAPIPALAGFPVMPTGTFMDSDVLVLAATWHLRPNNGGGVVYSFTHDDSQQLYLSGYETLTVTLCDGRNRLGEVRVLLSEMLALGQPEAEQIVQSLLERNRKAGPFLVLLAEATGGFTRVNAARVLRELATPKTVRTESRRLDVPLSLLLQPSFRCETDCIYCYAERPDLPFEDYMSPGRWVELLTEAGEAGVDLVSFGGGDPLTYPGLDQLLQAVARYNMKYLLPTKTLVTRPRAETLAHLMSDYGRIQISLDSLDAEIACQMTGVRNYAERAVTSIRNLLAVGLQVQTNTVATPLNLSGVERLVRELRQMGVARANITNYARTHHRHQDRLFLSLAQMEHLNTLVGRLREELKWPGLTCNASARDYTVPGSRSVTAWKNRASCSGGFSACTILPNGDVVLCEQMPHDPRFVVGNVARRSLMEVWQSPELMQFIVPDQALFAGTACGDCDEFDVCHRVFGRCFRDALFNYGSIHAPSPNCPRAPLGLRMG